MEFQSPRFAGNPILEGILNAPDDGVKKLKKGSPYDAVHAVQQALLDLYWVEGWHGPGPVLVESQFVDGDYGPWTEATVTAYKRHHDIHYPPSAATGTYDGYTGPATMKSLDQQCTMLDEAASEIRSHAEVLLKGQFVDSLVLAEPDLGRIANPRRRSAGAYRSAQINGENAEISYKRDIGAYEIHGAIFYEWVTHELASGHLTGALGFPTSDVETSDRLTSATFERGLIIHDASTDATTVSIDPQLKVLHHDIEF